MSDVTQILARIDHGDSAAAAELLPLVYDELRKLAAQKMAHEQPGQTLQATALVHEAYLRLVDGAPVQDWNCRGHFFGAAAEAMRRILIEQARRKDRLKHGGALDRHVLAEVAAPENDAVFDLLDLDAALSKLEQDEPQKAQLVKLRYFAGLSIDEAAAALGLSPATAKRHWAYARAWLYGQIRPQ
jgi:RNA polymerase sigma factor (TIGR02999 family)